MIISLIYNTTLLLSLSVIIELIPRRKLKNQHIKNLITGVTIGLIGITTMLTQFELAPGFLFDTRSILISITALFVGFVPTIIAAIMTAIFRLVQGGAGAFAGANSILISAVVGLLWRYFRLNKILKKKRKWLELYIFGLIVNFLIIANFLTLPWEAAQVVIIKTGPPIMIIFPIGTVVLGLILVSQVKHRETYKKLQESEERLKITLLSVGDGVVTTDEHGNITFLNPVAEEITGWMNEEVKGKPIDEILIMFNEYTKKPVEAPVKKVLDTGKIIGLANHTVVVCKDGTERPIADSAAPIKDESGNIEGVVLVIRDVTEERKKQREIDYFAYHDGLTGLYNHRFFDQELIRLDTEDNLPLSIILGDVNGLKLTNDAFGHTMGDKLLQEMAKNIKKACRKDDIVARWGGDEFVIILPNTSAKAARIICDRIDINCSNVKMADVNFSISLGYETKNAIDDDIMHVLRSAENHMYRKKSTESSSMRGNTIGTILSTLYEKNPREEKHSKRVSDLCKKIGVALELGKEEISELGVIGLMHDIGKIAINNSILNKEGALTEEEWNEIKRHPEIGYRILSASNDMAYIAEYILKHHERVDGFGYPKGIKMEDIPYQTKILTIADAYDAMTSNRSYKNALSDDMAIEELHRESGKAFDPDIVNTFIDKVLRK